MYDLSQFSNIFHITVLSSIVCIILNRFFPMILHSVVLSFIVCVFHSFVWSIGFVWSFIVFYDTRRPRKSGPFVLSQEPRHRLLIIFSSENLDPYLNWYERSVLQFVAIRQLTATTLVDCYFHNFFSLHFFCRDLFYGRSAQIKEHI